MLTLPASTTTAAAAAAAAATTTDEKQTKINLLPIVIIPGFMSTGLEIIESQQQPNWNGKRVWLNLSSIGISAMYFGNAQKKVNNRNSNSNSSRNNESNRNRKTRNGDDHDDDEDSNDDNDEQNNNEARQQYSYKSGWLQHMMLDTEDFKSDPSGGSITVRPIEGLDGVDYLAPGAMTNHVSYVFGPVIKALEKHGYNAKNGTPNNLIAATYDWRLSPKDMELRDRYYTNTKQMIEQLYTQNNNTPIVLLCHSMGCKVAHYFLNFIADNYNQSWIDQYIHTYMPVGGPHLGAPKALRGIISGDKMSLDTFLNDEEALQLGRSWGSNPWLIPSELPPGVPATTYILPHGVLEITFTHAIDTDPLIQKRTALSRPKRYQLSVTSKGLDSCTTTKSKSRKNNDGRRGGRDIRTPFTKLSRDLGTNVVVFTDTMAFVTGSELSQYHETTTLQFMLQEPGFASAKKEKERCQCHPCIWCLCCLCIPCMLAYKIIEWVINVLVRATTLTADAIAGSTGNSTTLAFSEIIKIPQSVFTKNSNTNGSGNNANVVTIKVPLYHTDDYGYENTGCCGMGAKRRRNARQVDLIVKLKWVQFNKEISVGKICGPVCRPSTSTTIRSGTDTTTSSPEQQRHQELSIVTKKKNGDKYEEFSGYDIMEREGLDRTLRFIRNTYDDDKYSPRLRSSYEPPPISRIHAIYGINIPTEIAAVYHRQDTCLSTNQLQSLYVPDKKAILTAEAKPLGYQLSNGILYETSKTKQQPIYDHDDTTCREVCGDGTVPYWSLAHCKTWNETTATTTTAVSSLTTTGTTGGRRRRREVTVEELDKAPHREILADPRFHDAVWNYVAKHS